MSAIAPIHQQTHEGIRFQVDEVEPAQDRIPVVFAHRALERHFQGKLITFSHSSKFKIIQPEKINPLASAVSKAFNEHRPLLLTPDIIWIAIAQGFAEHINHHAEEFRSSFVKHQGKKTLIVKDLIPRQAQDWDDIIHQWTLQLRDQVGATIYHLLECNFTTTTAIAQTVSRIVMMDTFREYFDYSFMGICGIPDISLLGTVEDWQKIYERVQSLAHYQLNWWTDRLLPLCKAFIATASGHPPLEFWQAIYKPKKTYGAELITGWLADLFPYIEGSIVTSQPHLIRNPILMIEREQLTADQGISICSIPLGLSRVPIKFTTAKTQKQLELIAGFIGVHQHGEWGVLKPEIGWAVLANKP